MQPGQAPASSRPSRTGGASTSPSSSAASRRRRFQHRVHRHRGQRRGAHPRHQGGARRRQGAPPGASYLPQVSDKHNFEMHRKSDEARKAALFLGAGNAAWPGTGFPPKKFHAGNPHRRWLSSSAMIINYNKISDLIVIKIRAVD